jgi:hypothetical protein
LRPSSFRNGLTPYLLLVYVARALHVDK